MYHSWIRRGDDFLWFSGISREGDEKTRDAPCQMELARLVLRNIPGNLFYRVVKTKVVHTSLAKWENFATRRQKGLRVNIYIVTYVYAREMYKTRTYPRLGLRAKFYLGQ